MKKPVLLAFVALLGTTTLFAQKFEVGINGGVVFNTVPTINNNNPITSSQYGKTKPSSLSAMGQLSAAYNYHKWQVGISVGVEDISYRYCPVIGPHDEPVNTYDKISLANEAYPISLFLNRKIVFKKLQVYGGISGGYVPFHSSMGFKGVEVWTNNSEFGNGFVVGGQIGANYYFTKHIGINAQATYQYMQLHVANLDYKFSAIPFTIGIRYRL